MRYEEAKSCCHVRSAIFRKAKGIKYWYNSLTPLDERISDEDKKENDWFEFDPRDFDNCSLSMFND